MPFPRTSLKSDCPWFWSALIKSWLWIVFVVLTWARSKANKSHSLFFLIGPLGCDSFKAVAEVKHSGDFPGSEQWDRVSSCVLHKMPWFINLSVKLGFTLWHVTLAFDYPGAVTRRRGRDSTSVELCPQPYWNSSPPGLLCHASSRSRKAICQTPGRRYKTPFSMSCLIWVCQCPISKWFVGGCSGLSAKLLAHTWLIRTRQHTFIQSHDQSV